MQPCVYIITNQRYGTLYIGVTSDLIKRIWQHKKRLQTALLKNISYIFWFGMSRKPQWNLRLLEKKH